MPIDKINFRQTQPITQNNTIPNVNRKKKEKDNTNIILGTLTGLGILGVGTYFLLKRNKVKGSKILTNIKDQLQDLNYKPEAGFRKGEDLFTGTAKGANGDKEFITKFKEGKIAEITVNKKYNTVAGEMYMPATQHKYIYDSNGKLVKIENYDYVHVSSVKPNESGFQYLKINETEIKTENNSQDIFKQQAELMGINIIK